MYLYFQIKEYEKLDNPEDRRKSARQIYDKFIMKELLARAHVSIEYCICKKKKFNE